MKSYIFRIELEDDGGWVAVIPALPGCVSEGDTREEAIAAVYEAATAYVEVLLEDGRTVPTDDIGTIVVEGPAVAVVA